MHLGNRKFNFFILIAKIQFTSVDKYRISKPFCSFLL